MAKEKISLFDYPARIVKKGIEELTESFSLGEISPEEYKEIVVTQGKIFPAPVKKETRYTPKENYTEDGFYIPGLMNLLRIDTDPISFFKNDYTKRGWDELRCKSIRVHCYWTY